MFFKKLSLFSFIMASTFGLAIADQRPMQQQQQQQPRQFEGRAQSGFQHWEGNMEDTLANPQDSTNEELEEEEREIKSYERKPAVPQQRNSQSNR